MPPAFLVALFLFLAAVSLLVSPMPPWVRRLNGTAFMLVGLVYVSDALSLLSMSEKAISLRYSIIVLSTVIVLTVAGWRIGGQRAWRR
jgi:hypothetical protein